MARPGLEPRGRAVGHGQVHRRYHPLAGRGDAVLQVKHHETGQIFHRGSGAIGRGGGRELGKVGLHGPPLGIDAVGHGVVVPHGRQAAGHGRPHHAHRAEEGLVHQGAESGDGTLARGGEPTHLPHGGGEGHVTAGGFRPPGHLTEDEGRRIFGVGLGGPWTHGVEILEMPQTGVDRLRFGAGTSPLEDIGVRQGAEHGGAQGAGEAADAEEGGRRHGLAAAHMAIAEAVGVDRPLALHHRHRRAGNAVAHQGRLHRQLEAGEKLGGDVPRELGARGAARVAGGIAGRSTAVPGDRWVGLPCRRAAFPAVSAVPGARTITAAGEGQQDPEQQGRAEADDEGGYGTHEKRVEVWQRSGCGEIVLAYGPGSEPLWSSSGPASTGISQQGNLSI